MSVFAVPFAINEWRRCRECGSRVEVILLNGASVPRDPYYRCSDCWTAAEATAARLDLMIEREQRPQLNLVEGGESDG